jgi:hypothetical protein
VIVKQGILFLFAYKLFENLQKSMLNRNNNEMQNTTHTKRAIVANPSLALPNIKFLLSVVINVDLHILCLIFCFYG